MAFATTLSLPSREAPAVPTSLFRPPPFAPDAPTVWYLGGSARVLWYTEDLEAPQSARWSRREMRSGLLSVGEIPLFFVAWDGHCPVGESWLERVEWEGAGVSGWGEGG